MWHWLTATVIKETFSLWKWHHGNEYQLKRHWHTPTWTLITIRKSNRTAPKRSHFQDLQTTAFAHRCNISPLRKKTFKELGGGSRWFNWNYSPYERKQRHKSRLPIDIGLICSHNKSKQNHSDISIQQCLTFNTEAIDIQQQIHNCQKDRVYCVAAYSHYLRQ